MLLADFTLCYSTCLILDADFMLIHCRLLHHGSTWCNAACTCYLPTLHFLPASQYVVFTAEFTWFYAVSWHYMVLHYLPTSQYVMLTAETTWFYVVSWLNMVLHYLPASQYVMLTAEFTWFYAVSWLYMVLHYLTASQYVILTAKFTQFMLTLVFIWCYTTYQPQNM